MTHVTIRFHLPATASRCIANQSRFKIRIAKRDVVWVVNTENRYRSKSYLVWLIRARTIYRVPIKLYCAGGSVQFDPLTKIAHLESVKLKSKIWNLARPTW
jgi:hypothetical protein